MQMELFPTCDLSPATKIRTAGSLFFIILLVGMDIPLLCFGLGGSKFPCASKRRDHAAFTDDSRFSFRSEGEGFFLGQS